MDEGLGYKKDEIIGVISIFSSLYILLSLFTYNLSDPVIFFRTTMPESPTRNLGGLVGAHISGLMVIVFGLSAFLVPLSFISFGIRRILRKRPQKVYLIGCVLLIISVSLILTLISKTFDVSFESYPDGLGGLFGKTIDYFSDKLFSLPGSYILSISLFILSIVILSPVSIFGIVIGKNEKVIKEAERDFTDVKIEEVEKDILINEPELNPLVEDINIKEKGLELKKDITKDDGYLIPSLELLKLPDSASTRPSKEEILADSLLIEKKLEDFGVEGKITQVHPGPIVTMYEFEPAPGVKINRIVSLSDDLALSLKAQSIRISPILGRASIGIEVPNKQREIVYLREILSSDIFQKSKSKLTLGLGKDIFGSPIVADLLRMPHLLVAGATGSGKSVSINTMIMSILFKATPKDVKMLMIDPKLLELSPYQDIPHLISNVITTPKEAAEALKKMVFEMERRYKVLADKAARNIDTYNLQVSEEEKLPYIVVIIDELADLMFTAPTDVEDSITRLAQMGRASGIHLIIATQRPSVDVITGIIKANFPARISFQVSSKVDSRTVLDAHGAEQLLGKGDMLLMLPGARMMRVHGALITEDEIRNVTNYLRTQGSPDYSIFDNLILPYEEDEYGAVGERDELYLKAIELGEMMGEISISLIQRRLKIGYNRAARIMELMEKDGLVGPPKGAGKPRDFRKRKD